VIPLTSRKARSRGKSEQAGREEGDEETRPFSGGGPAKKIKGKKAHFEEDGQGKTNLLHSSERPREERGEKYTSRWKKGAKRIEGHSSMNR